MKISSCLLAFGLVFASIYTIITFQYKTKRIKFIESLDKSDIDLYNKIIEERTNIYLQGQLIGLILSLFYIYYFRQNEQYNYCIIFLTSFVISILYYLISPKQNYMIDNLKTEEQIIAWRKLNNSMILEYILGFVIGIIGYILLLNIILPFFMSLKIKKN
jgi:hypothetical protein